MHRRALMCAISSLLLEHGFDSAEALALETLVEIMQSFLVEIGNSSRAYCELAGRSEPLAADVILALVNAGVRLSDMEVHARRPNKTVAPSPVPSAQPKQPSTLQAGVREPHPTHIPNHLPAFPDPHAYIRTPTHKQPVTEYEAIREKSAMQKKDIERALNKFAAKTSETTSLFLSQDNIFPIIACKPQFPPYLVALLPKDQVFEAEEDEIEESRSPQRKRQQKDTNANTESTEGAGPESNLTKEEEDPLKGESDVIDNPYLRPVKIPPPKIRLKDLVNAQAQSTTQSTVETLAPLAQPLSPPSIPPAPL